MANRFWLLERRTFVPVPKSTQNRPQGYSSKDASDMLYVSKRTVDGHLASVYGKLGVNNRVKAFRAATRLGLIPHEPTAGGPYVA